MNPLQQRRGANLGGFGLCREVIEACITVYREIGPGLLESVYEECLALELASRGLKAEHRKVIRFHYKRVQMVLPLRAAFLVEERVLVDVKSLNDILPVHKAQVRTMLRLTGVPLGLLVNFNVSAFEDGICCVAAGASVPTSRDTQGA